VIHVCIHPVHHEAISNPPEADWPPAFSGGIGALFQILEIQEYSSGLKHGPAAILNQNPFFEMASIWQRVKCDLG